MYLSTFRHNKINLVFSLMYEFLKQTFKKCYTKHVKIPMKSPTLLLLMRLSIALLQDSVSLTCNRHLLADVSRGSLYSTSLLSADRSSGEEAEEKVWFDAIR